MTLDVADVTPGALHCCIPGSRIDGHDLAGDALSAGASALLVERPLAVDAVQAVVGPSNARAAMADASCELYGHPSRSLLVVGVTGTNGKTSVAQLTKAILRRNGLSTMAIGTLGGPRTTPEAPVLQRLLARHVSDGGDAAVLEVSSHALVAKRVAGTLFRVSVFTNLSRDHLDFHGSMEKYFAAKASLFTEGRTELGVVNVEDPWGSRLYDSRPVPMRGFRLDDAEGLKLGPGGASFLWRGSPVRLRAGGRIGVLNSLAAATAAEALGVAPGTVAAALSEAPVVPGRLEPLEMGQPFAVWIDYAHTPDALASVLEAARVESAGRRVLVVFGCGGERDRGKRPEMGAVAIAGADVAIVTTDNPRSEDPLGIIEDVLLSSGTRGRIVVEPDRATAMELALRSARPGDVVVVAGKGHERYQDFGHGVLVPFDDATVACEILERVVTG